MKEEERKKVCRPSSCALVFGICPWTDTSCPFSSPAAEPPFIGGHPLGACLSRHPDRQLQGASIYAHCWLACGFMRVRCIMRPVVHRVKPVCLVPSSRPGTQHVYTFWTSVERSVSRRLNGGLSIEIIELSRRDLRKRFCWNFEIMNDLFDQNWLF